MAASKMEPSDEPSIHETSIHGAMIDSVSYKYIATGYD